MSDAITGWIKTRREMEQAATEGPWQFQHWGGQNQNGDYAESILFDGHGETLVYGLPDDDGEFITASRTAMPALLDAVESVLRLHESGDMTCYSPSHTNPDTQCPECRVICAECYEDFPCTTVTTITTALEGGR